MKKYIGLTESLRATVFNLPKAQSLIPRMTTKNQETLGEGLMSKQTNKQIKARSEHMPVTPAAEKLRQENLQLKANLPRPYYNRSKQQWSSVHRKKQMKVNVNGHFRIESNYQNEWYLNTDLRLKR